MPVASVNSRVARLLAGLTTSAILLCGQSNATQKPGSVEGVTINSVTSAPIRKATVTLMNARGTPNYSAMTNAAGEFRIANIEPGYYQPEVARDGYSSLETRGHVGRFKPIHIGEDQQVSGVSFQLLPLAVVGGHVLDEDGDPIANVRVMAIAFNYNPYGERQPYFAGSAMSNDLGEFQIINLEPGRYYFRAVPQKKWANLPPNTKGMTPELDYVTTYYPNAKQIAQASSTQIAPGALLTNMDFRLQEAPVFHIRGKAVSEDGKPIGRAPMFLTAAGEMYLGGPLAQVQRDGSFELSGVASGSYDFFGRSGGDPGEGLAANQSIIVSGQDVNNVIVVFKKPIELIPKFEGKCGSSLASQIHLVSVARGSLNSFSGRNGPTAVLRASPVVSRIVLNPGASSYVKSIRFGDQDVSSGRIDLTNAASGGTLTIACSDDPGEVQGTVTKEDGTPATQASITLVPADDFRERRDLFYRLSTGETGKFDYRDIAPGDYKVYAWEGDETMVYFADFRKAFDSKAASVHIDPSGHTTIDLKLITAAEIAVEKEKHQ